MAAPKNLDWTRQYVKADRSLAVINNTVPRIVVPPRGSTQLNCDVTPKQEAYGGNRYTITTIAAIYDEANAVNTDVFPEITVYTPSSLLRVSLRVAFESQTPGNARSSNFGTDGFFFPALHTTNFPKWRIIAVSQDPVTGVLAPLTQVYPADTDQPPTTFRKLPDGYEADTAAPVLRAYLTLNRQNFDTSYFATTDVVHCKVYTCWEPNDGTLLGTQKLADLYTQCKVTGPTSPLLIRLSGGE